MKKKDVSRGEKGHNASTKSDSSDRITNVFCTGLTMDDLAGNVDLMAAGDEMPARCYLCKREEGARTFSMKASEIDEPLLMDAPLHLVPIVRRMMRLRMHFKVCVECAALLGVTGDDKADVQFS